MTTTRRRRPRTRGLVVLLTGFLAVALSLTAGGCGLREDERPREISQDSLPRSLFQNSPESTLLPGTPATELHLMFLIRSRDESENLVPVQAAIPSPERRSDLPRVIIEKLVAEPPINAVAPGYDGPLTSDIPQDTKVLGVRQDGDVLTIDLSKQLGQVESTRQRMAVAQIVFTATAIPGINAVRFTIDGSPTAVNLDERSSDPGELVNRDDFPKLRLGTGTTTTTTSTTLTVAPDSIDELPAVDPATEAAP